VATSQPLAVHAGLDALRCGGNAVDAALAAAITLTVVEPNNNGLGSDAFCLLWDGHEVVGLNASGRAPMDWSLSRFRGLKKMPELGWDSVTVPGAVSSWIALSKRYGQLDFLDLFNWAIHYAEEGFLVGPKTAYYWQLLEHYYDDFPDFSEHFLPAPKSGEIFRRPDLAKSLRQIASTRGEDFYQGDLARAIANASAAGGGALNLADMQNHKADWVKPIAQTYRGVELHEIPPNGQGLAAQIALGILQNLPLSDLDSAQQLHHQIEAMKIAVHASQQHFADEAAMFLSPEALLAPGSLALAAQSIGDEAQSLPPMTLPVSHDTVYLACADSSGMMVSFIQSNFRAFGSGIVIPDTGIAMQNRGSGFDLDPQHPNCVGPNKRPFHTIIPGFVTQGGMPFLSFGVMGGHMQHQGHVQMVSRIWDHGQNPQAASDAPRWHIYPDMSVGLETGISESIAQDLEARGHKVRFDSRESTFGGAQLIQKLGSGYVGGSDHRKEGFVAGF
jgi:gamma-glutamyltranspeptidase/glutathione hydrolase